MPQWATSSNVSSTGFLTCNHCRCSSAAIASQKARKTSLYSIRSALTTPQLVHGSFTQSRFPFLLHTTQLRADDVARLPKFEASHEEDERAPSASDERHRARHLGCGRGREGSESYRPSQCWRLRTCRKGEGRKSSSSAVAYTRTVDC